MIISEYSRSSLYNGVAWDCDCIGLHAEWVFRMRDWTDFEDEEVEVLEYGGGKAVLAKCDTVNTGPCTPMVTLPWVTTRKIITGVTSERLFLARVWIVELVLGPWSGQNKAKH